MVLTQRNICRHAECDCGGQGRGFGEEVQVPQGKGQLDRLVHLYCNLGKEAGQAQERIPEPGTAQAKATLCAAAPTLPCPALLPLPG